MMYRQIYTFSVLSLLLNPLVGKTNDGFREAEIKSLSSYSRLVFPISNSSGFKMEGKTVEGAQSTIKLSLDRVQSGRWGDVTELKDQRVAKVEVEESGVDGAILTIQFQKPGTSYFAYLQPSPPAVIVDVWPDTNAPKSDPMPVAVKPKRATANRKIASIASVRETKKERPLRRSLASIDQVSNVDATLAPLDLKTEFFEYFLLPMPPLVAKGEKFSSPSTTDLENHWEFGNAAKGKKDEISLQFQFAIKLFKSGKYALSLKTLEIMNRDHPVSPYSDEQKFLEALCYKRLSEIHKKPVLLAKSEMMLRELMTKLDEKKRNLPFSATIRLYFTAKSYQNKQWLDAVEEMEYVVKLLGQGDPDYAVVSMALGESYRASGQGARAERIYRYVAEKFKNKDLGMESLFRIGNILTIEKNFRRATEELENAIKTYPEYVKERTEAYFNLGESYFWLKDYERSTKNFLEFTKRFPSQTIAAHAYVRLGEIAELTKKPSAVAKEYYRTAINGFPFSLGASFASLRLARINLPEESDFGYHMSNINAILARKDISTEMRQMAQLLKIQSFRIMGDTESALSESLSAISQLTGHAYDIFRDEYIKANGEHFARLVREKEYSAALSYYEQNKKWLELFGAETYRFLAEAYKGLGLFDSSNKFYQVYAAEIRKQKGDTIGRSIASVLKPAQAKNLFEQGEFSEVLQVIPDKPDNVEDIFYRMMSHHKLGQSKMAYTLAEQIKDQVIGLGPQAYISTIEILTDRALSDKNYFEMEALLGTARKSLPDPDARLDFLYADALWYLRKHEAAAKAYELALERFPKNERAERSRYNLAMSYLALDKRKEGVKLLTELQAGGQSVWAMSASRELELLKWESKYTNIIRTLKPSGVGIVQ